MSVATASILIFMGFSKLKIRKSITKLSKQSFEIYLFHAGIWDVCSVFITKDMHLEVVTICIHKKNHELGISEYED